MRMCYNNLGGKKTKNCTPRRRIYEQYLVFSDAQGHVRIFV